jgi:hypothetical protein
MGSTIKVQGREPDTMGAAMPARVGVEKLVKVSWRTVVEYDVLIPAAAWERMGGAEGDAAGPVDDYLSDVEADGGTLIERAVTLVESGYES